MISGAVPAYTANPLPIVDPSEASGGTLRAARYESTRVPLCAAVSASGLTTLMGEPAA